MRQYHRNLTVDPILRPLRGRIVPCEGLSAHVMENALYDADVVTDAGEEAFDLPHPVGVGPKGHSITFLNAHSPMTWRNRFRE